MKKLLILLALSLLIFSCKKEEILPGINRDFNPVKSDTIVINTDTVNVKPDTIKKIYEIEYQVNFNKSQNRQGNRIVYIDQMGYTNAYVNTPDSWNVKFNRTSGQEVYLSADNYNYLDTARVTISIDGVIWKSNFQSDSITDISIGGILQ